MTWHMRRPLLALLLVYVSACASGHPESRARAAGRLLTEAEAIARAEEFVRVNGYVRTEDADPKRMVVERNLTYGSTPEELLPQRAGTLLPRACGVWPKPARGFDDGWSVIFCFNPTYYRAAVDSPDWKISIRQRSRVVVMDPYGSDIFIPHPDFGLTGHGIKRLPGMDDFERMLGR